MRTPTQDQGGILLLGIGNILWADEGFGVRVVEYLSRHYRLPAPVRLMDGGTQGLYLLPHLEDLDTLIVIDAIDFGLPPASRHEARGAEVPSTIGARKMSLHQTGFQEVLALLELMGRSPEHIVLLGVQPVTMQDYGGGLTPAVADQIAPTAQRALDVLQELTGLCAAPRGETPLPDEALMTPAVARDPYEAGRPPADIACRFGDARILAGSGY